MTGYSSAKTPILGEMYIHNYILSVIVVKVLSDSETSPRTQTVVSALFGDRLTASIQVVTGWQSPLFRPSASILVATRRQSLLSRPSKTISWSASPRNKYVLGSESTSSERIYATMLLYISVCLRTRQDSISYSFIYIVQKLELETVDRDRGTMELLRSYTEITPKLLRNYGTGTMAVELWNYSEVIVACYSPLLVLVCWSVSQDPPRPIEHITVAFGLLYSPSTALSQSAVSYVHVASGRPISDRLSPDTAVLSFALRKYLLN